MKRDIQLWSLQYTAVDVEAFYFHMLLAIGMASADAQFSRLTWTVPRIHAWENSFSDIVMKIDRFKMIEEDISRLSRMYWGLGKTVNSSIFSKTARFSSKMTQGLGQILIWPMPQRLGHPSVFGIRTMSENLFSLTRLRLLFHTNEGIFNQAYEYWVFSDSFSSEQDRKILSRSR